MAKLTTYGPQPTKPMTSNVEVSSSTVARRKISNLLPAVNRTEALSKFLNATADHLFQPENVEFLSGYIGSKPVYYNRNKDFYVNESTQVRRDYQLPPTAVSHSATDQSVTNVMFYDDLLDQLKTQGANVVDPSRLFDAEYYSWSPPIDLDKFVNFYEYYWLADGPPAILLLNTTDLKGDAIGKTEYIYEGSWQRRDGIVLQGSLRFSSGMRIRTAIDVDPNFNGRTLLIEGVGRNIQISEDVIWPNPSWNTVGWNLRGWDGDEGNTIPDYMTMARFSDNLNPWGINNRWFHRDVIQLSGIDVTTLQAQRAQRPIIEFVKDLELYNFGTQARPEVDLIDTINTDVFASIAGMPSYQLDGVTLLDGMKILVTADANPEVNHRIYAVSGIEAYGVIGLDLVTAGGNSTGAPLVGDSTYVRFGNRNGGKSYWFNGTVWQQAQGFIKGQPPLFRGYDRSGTALDDPTYYQGSSFKGTPIFTYATDSNAPIDPVLGIQAKLDQFGDFVYENALATRSYTYVQDAQSANIYGYIWYKSADQLGNGWYKSRNGSRQYVINAFDITTATSTFLIDQRPDAYTPGELDTLEVTRVRDGSSQTLMQGVDYVINGRIVLLVVPAQDGERIEIRSWSSKPRSAQLGYYEVPINLLSNPNNDQPGLTGYNQVNSQFQQIIARQENGGSGTGSTAWRDSAQVRGLGTSIVQHRAPMLKLMLLNSTNINTGLVSGTSPIDPSLAIQFAQREYVRFYNRFVRTLLNLWSSGLGNDVTPAKWIENALQQVNLGKTKASAWAYSGYEQNWDFSPTSARPTFVPPTAARLGVAPVYKPEAYLDDDYVPAKLTLLTHDGARIIMLDSNGDQLGTIAQGALRTSNPSLLTNPVAAAWLQFELDIYTSMQYTYQDPDSVLCFDQRKLVPGKWRQTDYTRSEYLDVTRPSFDKWTIQTQVDWRANTTWQLNNQFSFNYRTCVDQDGEPVPGHWRGIYRWFYDTDRPHVAPWEMLGFSQKPTWWDAEYGVAPYTRGNTHLWEDLRDGLIRYGNRAGTQSEWARPGLMSCIPVDDQGLLLPPIEAGVIVSLPGLAESQAEWTFGDGAPVEQVWLTSIDYGFVIALSGYLMKPAQFIEYAWDPLRTVRVSDDDCQQFLYLDTDRRRSSREFYVHREDPTSISGDLSIPNESNSKFFGSWGIQHWISEYLVSQNLSVTNYFGSVIRGAESQLAHKFGGFVSTDNSLRVLADSFGQIGYTSQIVPSENIKTYLYRSTSTGTFFYSGIIVVKQSNGWKVYGYDGIDPFFTTIPSVQSGSKSTMVIGNQTAIDYKSGQGLVRVPYGTTFGTRQEVYDFVVSYGRWLENQGWVFDAVNSDSGKIIDWRQSARDFMYWSQGNWSNGNFVALSPAAGSAKFTTDFGTIQYLSGTIGGTYPVLDKTGRPIEQQNLAILRQDGELTLTPTNNQTLYGLRLFTSTIEHIMLLDNTTQFNDTIYDPLYTVYQPRLKVYGYRTNGWNGRLDAPGYFLYQDPDTNQWSMIENFEKTSDDFRKLYNIDQPKNAVQIDNSTGNSVTVSSRNHAVTRSDLNLLSKHTVGYQSREYLQNLLIDETTQFEFYQGFIRQKGTRRAIDSILRSTSISTNGESINYFEEYALRKGRYGAVKLNTNIDFVLDQSDFGNSPQRIDVFGLYDSDRSKSGVITLVPRDPRIIVPPENYEGRMFTLRQGFNADVYEDLPNAGYVQLGEADYYVTDQTALLSLSDDLARLDQKLEPYDVIWQFITTNLTWDIYKLVPTPANVIATATSSDTGQWTQIEFDGPHGLVNGDIIVCSGFANNSTLNTTFVVQDAVVNRITVQTSTFIAETSGTVLVYRSVRFASGQDVNENPMLGGWREGDLIYVDNSKIDSLCLALDPNYTFLPHQWVVYKQHIGTWIPVRKAQPKIAAELIKQALLYSKSNLNVLAYLDYFDPAKGFIPGIADKEISYKNLFDPAKYNSGNSEVYSINPDSAWGTSHVGEVWWDLSTTRYINYEQGNIDYRIRNWGKLAPDTTIMIYEWVRSPVSPSDWATYVASGTPLSQYGLDYVPSGVVRNASDPAWTETVEYDSNGTRRTWYYFWVASSDMVPQSPGRELTTNEITRIITNPNSNNLPWYAAVGERTLIVANIYTSLNGSDTVMQIVYTDRPNDANDFKEWSLIREGDAYSRIDDQYWDKLRDSLTGFDRMGNTVPDLYLNEMQRYGNLIRPRQSWFKDRLAALEIWVNKVNTQLSSADSPLTLDPEWDLALSEYLNQGEPLPPPGDYDYVVADMTELSYIPNSVIDEAQIEINAKALVQPTPANDNLWTIWQWDGNEWNLIRKQSYSVPRYWTYADWYLTGYSADTIPTYIVSAENDRDDLVVQEGETVKVLNNGSGYWALYGRVDGELRLVGLESGTIQITSNIWDSELNLCGFDRKAYDVTLYDYNPLVEIGLLFDCITGVIYDKDSSMELNQQFFSMLNYVFSEQKFVDWAFKTSYILVSGSNESLNQSQLYQPNTVDYLLDFINEAKPYRTKVRDFVSSRSTQESVLARATDFDRPSYQGRILDMSLVEDANVLVNDSTYADWYANYRTNPNLIRQIKTQLVFDRISSMPKQVQVINAESSGNTVRFTVSPMGSANSFTLGETIRVYGVSDSVNPVMFNSTDVKVSSASGNVIIGTYGSNIGIGTGTGGVIYHQSWGAANRIMDSYDPTQYMPPAFAPDLISGTDYRGHIYAGTNFNLEPGWGVAPWDFAAGWEAAEAAFDQYLDMILQGGVPPIYDQFFGNGTRKQFRLSKIPQDLMHTRVWRDRVLAQYGQDYTIPNWLIGAEIADPGQGYAVDDLLELAADEVVAGTIPARVVVTEVSAGGSIAKVRIAERGYYPMVQHGSYRAGPAPYSTSTGSGARVQPIWGGDTLIFTDAPLSSDTPNIWVLYAGTTFEASPDGAMDLVTDGDGFSQPNVAEDHAEELYPVKLNDAIIIDTYSQPQGGRPLVAARSYITDGARDQFDLGLRPQDTAAVFAYLDGVRLVHGVTNDYVINFETSRLVFLVPPPAGKTLTIRSIGEGGTGYSVQSAYVAQGGDFYTPGDVITLDGITEVSAKVRVATVSGTDITLIGFGSGSGYKTGDKLLLVNDGAIFTKRLVVRVTKTSSNGAIQEWEIESKGSYSQVPAIITWQTTGKGTGAAFDVVWGVDSVDVIDPGLYKIKPTAAVGQADVTPNGGTGAQFLLTWTNIRDQQSWVAGVPTASTSSYTLNVYPPSIDYVMVTVDGIVTSATLEGNVITISAPDYGSYVVATVFNTNSYSEIQSQEFIIIEVDPTGLILSYPLSRTGYSTVPDYLSTVVSVQNEDLEAPPINTYRGNGFARRYAPDHIPVDLNDLQVYVDGELNTLDPSGDIGTYGIDDGKVVFNYSPTKGSVITLIVTDTYEYLLDGNTIIFNPSVIQPDDKVTVTTFSQDISYGFTTERFAGSTTGLYELSNEVSSESTLTVTINGDQLDLLWDYTLFAQLQNGFQVQAFELTPFETGEVEKYFIKINPNISQAETDVVVVRYMTGRAERPGTAFRQFVDRRGQRLSQALPDGAKTYLLSNVYVDSESIEVEDYRMLTAPMPMRPGAIWIGSERIEFAEVIPSPTTLHPNRALLTNLLRGSGGTSGDPRYAYRQDFWDGDGTRYMFPTPSSDDRSGETVSLDGKILSVGYVQWSTMDGTSIDLSIGKTVPSSAALRVYANGVLLAQNLDYFLIGNDMIRFDTVPREGTLIKVLVDATSSVRSQCFSGIYPDNDPESQSLLPGRYILFSTPPGVGSRNVLISTMVKDTLGVRLSHVAGSLVIDAGFNVQIPGGYDWEPAPRGLQYSRSDQAKFLLVKTGTRS